VEDYLEFFQSRQEGRLTIQFDLDWDFLMSDRFNKVNVSQTTGIT